MAEFADTNKVKEPSQSTSAEKNVPSYTIGDKSTQPLPILDTTHLSSESALSAIEDVVPAIKDVVPPPDGGVVAWLQVLAGMFANALTWGLATGFGIFQDYYVQHLKKTASQIAWIGGLQAFLFFFIGAFSGRATDAGLTRFAVLIGSTMLVFGIFMTSLATTYWQVLLAQGVCVGIGGGILFIPILTVVGTYFSKKKSLAVGAAASGTGVGGLVFPALVQHLTPRIGFPWAVRCMGFVALTMAIIMNAYLKPRLPPRRSGSLFELSAFKEPVYAFYTAGAFLIFWALFVGFAYINLYARETLHFSAAEAVNLLLIMNGVGIPSRLVCNYVADRWLGPINTMIPASACLSLMFFCWIGVDNRVGLYVFAVFYGIAASGTQGLFAGSLASVTNDLSRLGVRMGMVFALCAFSSLTGPSIAGAITGADSGSYTGTQVWAGCMVLCGSLCLLASRICRTGWVLRKRA